MPNIFQLLNSVILSRALYVCADLHIADYLKQHPLDLDALSQKTNSCPSALQRLLYFLELHEVFTKDTDGNYHNTAFSKTMCSDHPQTIKPFLVHDDQTRWNAFGHLGYSIQTGASSFEMLYKKNYFDYTKEHSLLQERFDQAMKIISFQEDQTIAQTIPFQGTIADIGGGIGQLLHHIHQQHPQTKGILFDLPEVVANLQSTSCTPIPGSFFETISIKADIFILKRILHDWDDEKALQILTSVAHAMDQNSTLYIIDGILDRAQDKQLLAAIDLALLAIFQGKERTFAQIEHLLNKAHLKIISVTPIDNLISAIQCTKE